MLSITIVGAVMSWIPSIPRFWQITQTIELCFHNSYAILHTIFQQTPMSPDPSNKETPKEKRKAEKKDLELYSENLTVVEEIKIRKSQGKRYRRDVGGGGIKLHENPAARLLNTTKIQ